MKDLNILMVGVGGQGVIRASDIMVETAVAAGYDVKKSDSIGMAQRGGSVVSHIRLGENVYSPLIQKGTANFLLAFEELEAARWADYLVPDSTAIVADMVLPPLTVMVQGIPYPDWDEISGILKQQTEKVYLIPAGAIVEEVENLRAMNMVMLGFLSTYLEIERSDWEEKIRDNIPARFMESSLKAFSRGAAEADKIKNLSN